MWKVQPADPRAAQRLSHAAGIDPITAQLLLNRGVGTAEEAARFLNPDLAGLTDPYELPDMGNAVSRLRRAIAEHEPILIFGDSDVDGISASALLYEVLRGLGALVRIHLSNRVADGYGVPEALVGSVCRSSIKVVILVDCGTNQLEVVRRLAARGIDTIIIDHHVPLERWAQPYALVNPHRPDASQMRELSSAGLAFKTAQALYEDPGDDRLAGCLDLAALGTLADCSPLVREARILVAEGLPRIVRSRRWGLRRLCEATKTSNAEPEQILRRLVPRLNAGGRLGESSAVLGLLVSECQESADEWLTAAEAAHATTKGLHRQLIGEAHEQVNRLNFRDHYVLVVSRAGWHQGLMGPVASQLAERYGRPAIAISMDEQAGIGSGRSIPAFNLLEALRACEGLLVRFGGHAQACGLTVNRRCLEEFCARVNDHARLALGRAGLVRTRAVDVELPLSEVTPQWVSQTQRFAPFGRGNPRPTVIVRGLTIERQSPRAAVLSDGTRKVPGKGMFPADVSGGRYDVVASPSLVDGELALTVSDAKASPAL